MKFIADLSKKTWKVTLEEEDSSENTSVSIGFIDGKKKVIVFDNLSFGVTIKHLGEELSESFPPSGVVYESTDQEIVHSLYFNTAPDEALDVFVWVEHGGDFFSTEKSVITKKPAMLYPSWSWNDKDKIWVSPTPYPDDMGTYVWNEENLSWREVTLDIE